MSSNITQKTTPWTASRLFAIAFAVSAFGLLLVPFAGPGVAFVFGFIGLLMFGQAVYKLVKLVEWYMLTGRN